MSTCGVTEALHLKETNLVQTTSKDVDDVSVVRGTFGEVVVELRNSLLAPYVVGEM